MATLFIYLLSLVVWLGGMIFFSAFTAPAVFSVLSTADAGKVVGTIFPRYYILGYVAGVISTILGFYFAFGRGPRLWWSFAGIALAIGLGLTFYAGTALRPRINAIRSVNTDPNPDPAMKAEFDKLHRLSVMLNGGAIVLNLLALLSSAAALTPNG
ncbi:MAG TPA: DUF4149 domain-containing protein [Candidatus Binataceae bacterium]|nr:DUF4149 domain-containing protein [Candidatus Binataceae bacterium]